MTTVKTPVAPSSRPVNTDSHSFREPKLDKKLLVSTAKSTPASHAPITAKGNASHRIKLAELFGTGLGACPKSEFGGL